MQIPINKCRNSPDITQKSVSPRNQKNFVLPKISKYCLSPQPQKCSNELLLQRNNHKINVYSQNKNSLLNFDIRRVSSNENYQEIDSKNQESGSPKNQSLLTVNCHKMPKKLSRCQMGKRSFRPSNQKNQQAEIDLKKFENELDMKQIVKQIINYKLTTSEGIKIAEYQTVQNFYSIACNMNFPVSKSEIKVHQQIQLFIKLMVNHLKKSKNQKKELLVDNCEKLNTLQNKYRQLYTEHEKLLEKNLVSQNYESTISKLQLQIRQQQHQLISQKYNGLQTLIPQNNEILEKLSQIQQFIQDNNNNVGGIKQTNLDLIKLYENNKQSMQNKLNTIEQQYIEGQQKLGFQRQQVHEQINEYCSSMHKVWIDYDDFVLYKDVICNFVGYFKEKYDQKNRVTNINEDGFYNMTYCQQLKNIFDQFESITEQIFEDGI